MVCFAQAERQAKHNVLADPLFAAPQMDDYRLLPGSPALHPGGDRIAGAFPQIPADYQAPPTLRVTAGRRQGAQLPLTLAVKSAAPVRKMRYTINDRTGEEQAFTATVTAPGGVTDPDGGNNSAIETAAIKLKIDFTKEIIGVLHSWLLCKEAAEVLESPIRYHGDILFSCYA